MKNHIPIDKLLGSETTGTALEQREVVVKLNYSWIWIAGLLMASVMGCRSGGGSFPRLINEPAPVVAEVREGFGRIALLPVESDVRFASSHPEGYAEAAATLAGATFKGLEKATERFVAGEAVNSPMTFAAGARVRVISVPEGRLLHSSYLDYRGAEYRFVLWGRDGAKRFRTELERAEQVIGEAILDQLIRI